MVSVKGRSRVIPHPVPPTGRIHKGAGRKGGGEAREGRKSKGKGRQGRGRVVEQAGNRNWGG